MTWLEGFHQAIREFYGWPEDTTIQSVEVTCDAYECDLCGMEYDYSVEINARNGEGKWAGTTYQGRFEDFVNELTKGDKSE